MTPAPNPFKTTIFRAPAGMEDECDQLEILRQGNMLISCWEPSETELELLRAGAKVWLYVIALAQPPVALRFGPDKANTLPSLREVTEVCYSIGD